MLSESKKCNFVKVFMSVPAAIGLLGLVACSKDDKLPSSCPAYQALSCTDETTCGASGCYLAVDIFTNSAQDPGCTQLFTVDFADNSGAFEFTAPMVFQRLDNQGRCQYTAYASIPPSAVTLPVQVLGLTQTCFNSNGDVYQMPTVFAPPC